MTERESIVFYRSFYEAIKLQPKKIQADLYNALLEYAFTGEVIEMNNAVKSVFLLIKPQIDANNTRYENSKKGGRPKKGKTDSLEKNMKIKTNGFENNEKTETDSSKNNNENSVSEKPNVNVNENVNVNDNVKKKKDKKESVPPVRYSENDKLDKAIHDYINHRKKVKAPMTDHAVELMINKLDSWADNDEDKIKILEQSIFNGWKGIFPLNEQENRKTESPPAVKPTRFTNFEEHDWDFDELSRIKQAELMRKLEESNV